GGMNNVVTRTVAEEALGVSLPSRRLEEWKWTDLKRLVDRAYSVSVVDADAAIIERLAKSAPLADVMLPRILIVNGQIHSKSDSVRITRAAPAIAHADPLLSLNVKLQAKSICLQFEENIDQPVEVLHITTGQGAAVASRLHVSVAAGASATVIETFVGEGEYLHNPITTIDIAKGGRLDRVKIETESASAQHLSHVIATIADNAILNDFTLTAGAVLNRQNANIDFNGQNSSAKVAGSYLLNDNQHADTRLIVDHKVPHCMSRELFKCVMDEKARGIFQGKVIVRPNAQKIDGKQSSHALLLSETAEFDAKPELEIYADDVICGHGTTCGDLNPDHMFYLKSRGIPAAEARVMLVEAFVDEAVDTIENQTVREAVLAMVHKRLFQ
ncbi:MAG: Fe-S cluster assembly protein SufD, partial [Usitatibacteraceae bacterium]